MAFDAKVKLDKSMTYAEEVSVHQETFYIMEGYRMCGYLKQLQIWLGVDWRSFVYNEKSAKSMTRRKSSLFG